MENETQRPSQYDERPAPQSQNPFIIPVSIVLAGLIIGGAVLYSNKPAGQPIVQGGNTAVAQAQEIKLEPVTADDHVLGNRDADIILVEFSDLECPFCKIFQGTAHALLDQYGKDGKLAWAYRHYPIVELHPKSPKESEASECVNELGGSQKFWQFIDKIYQITPSNNGLDPALLETTAASLGINAQAFTSCLDSGKYKDKIDNNLKQALAAGGKGTPHSVFLIKTPLSAGAQAKVMKAVADQFAIIAPNSNIPPDLYYFDKTGNKFVFSGALPIEIIKAAIDTILAVK